MIVGLTIPSYERFQVGGADARAGNTEKGLEQRDAARVESDDPLGRREAQATSRQHAM